MNFFFWQKDFTYTHTHTHTDKTYKSKVLTSYVSLVHIYKGIVWSENFTSSVLSVNVRSLKIIIKLIKHKTICKQTKTKKAVFLCANKLLRRDKSHLFCPSILFICILTNFVRLKCKLTLCPYKPLRAGTNIRTWTGLWGY